MYCSWGGGHAAGAQQAACIACRGARLGGFDRSAGMCPHHCCEGTCCTVRGYIVEFDGHLGILTVRAELVCTPPSRPCPLRACGAGSRVPGAIKRGMGFDINLILCTAGRGTCLAL